MERDYKKSLLPLLSVSIMLALSGCGGSGSSSPSAASASVSGTAMAGPFKSGQVCAYSLTNGVQGNQLACSGFDASSRFSMSLGDYVGDLLLAVETGATYDDEATSGDETNGTALTGTLRTIVKANGSSLDVPITPLTEAVVRLLTSLTPEAMAEQAAIISGLFPLDANVNILTTLPSLADTHAPQMTYREILRALSQLQTTANMQGDIGSYLNMLIATLTLGDTAAINALKAQLVAEIQKNLDTACSVNNNVLSCVPPVTGGGDSPALRCDTSKFAAGAPVHLPTAMELLAFAGPYSGKEGSYNDDFTTFNTTGDAQLLLGVDGKTLYNGKEYALNSICTEDHASYGKMLYLHLGAGHLDLFVTPYSDGTGLLKWSGTSPANADKIVKGNYVQSGGDGSGTGGTGTGTAAGVTFSAPVEGFNSISNSVVTLTDRTKNDYTLISKKGTWGDPVNAVSLVMGYSKQTTPYSSSGQVETLEVIVAKGMPMVSAPLDTQGYLCTLSADYPIAKCADKGITFDRAAGLISFNATPMKTVVGSAGSFTVTGSLNFTPF